MANPLDDDTAHFHVLVNPEGQHSLWPVFAHVPAGWDIVLKDAVRGECLKYIDTNWTDMRPASLQHTMSQDRENAHPPANDKAGASNLLVPRPI